jgi:imidazolonepropionase
VNFNFGSGEFADARRMIDADCAIALSTDFNPGSAPCPSQPMSMSIACRYQKLLPAEAFNAATINAAHAIGVGESVGSIEVGKVADLLLLDCEDYRLVTYEFGGSLIKSVLKKGKLVYESK